MSTAKIAPTAVSFLLDALHVEHPERHQEEGQVADQEDQPRRAGAPPRILPRQRADRVEQDFHKDAEDRAGDGKEQPVGQAQDLHASCRRAASWRR